MEHWHQYHNRPDLYMLSQTPYVVITLIGGMQEKDQRITNA